MMALLPDVSEVSRYMVVGESVPNDSGENVAGAPDGAFSRVMGFRDMVLVVVTVVVGVRCAPRQWTIDVWVVVVVVETTKGAAGSFGGELRAVVRRS